MYYEKLTKTSKIRNTSTKNVKLAGYVDIKNVKYNEQKGIKNVKVVLANRLLKKCTMNIEKNKT